MQLPSFGVTTTITAILGMLLLYLWVAYNGFIKARNEVKTDFADIDVQLKRRAGLIENLVEVVREYAKHEESTFEGVAKARSLVSQPHSPAAAAQADNMLTSTLKTIFAVSEAYPELKASDNFKRLQDDLKETEDKIAHYREEYNQTVLRYNTKIQTFPNLLVAGLFGFKEEELFQPTNEADREDIHLSTKQDEADEK